MDTTFIAAHDMGIRSRMTSDMTQVDNTTAVLSWTEIVSIP